MVVKWTRKAAQAVCVEPGKGVSGRPWTLKEMMKMRNLPNCSRRYAWRRISLATYTFLKLVLRPWITPKVLMLCFDSVEAIPSHTIQPSPTDRTLTPFSNQMTERKGSKKIISQNLLAHLLTSMLLTLEMYKIGTLQHVYVCTHTRIRGPLTLMPWRPPFLPAPGLVRPVCAWRPNWRQASSQGNNLPAFGAGVWVCWHGDWPVGCQQRKHGC